jgi:hypothetical protein
MVVAGSPVIPIGEKLDVNVDVREDRPEPEFSADD